MSLTSVARKVLSTAGAAVSAAWRISANSFSRLMASLAGACGACPAQSAGMISGAIVASCGSSILRSVEGIQNPHACRPSCPLARVQPGMTEARQGDGESGAKGTGTSGGGGLRHLLARLGFDQRSVAAEFGGHLQQLFFHQRISHTVGHAAGAIGLKAIMVNFEHCHSPSA